MAAGFQKISGKKVISSKTAEKAKFAAQIGVCWNPHRWDTTWLKAVVFGLKGLSYLTILNIRNPRTMTSLDSRIPNA